MTPTCTASPTPLAWPKILTKILPKILPEVRTTFPARGIRLQTEAMQRPQADRPDCKSQVDEREQQIAWMAAVARGDGSAYRSLCDRYLGPIFGFAQRMVKNEAEAEEIAQETFLRVWKDAGRYKPTAAVSTWIYRIAHNLCIDRLRRRRPDMDRVSQLDAAERTSGLYEQKVLSERVNDALAALPARQRTAICLVHYDGMTQQEAATVLDTNVEAVESLLARGRKALRKKLAGLRKEGDAP